MNKGKNVRLSGLLFFLALALGAAMPLAAEEEAQQPAEPPAIAANAYRSESVEAQKAMYEYGFLGISVALIVVSGALATAFVQGRIGPAVAAACVEDRKYLPVAILLMTLPETILILSIGLAYLLMQKIF